MAVFTLWSIIIWLSISVTAVLIPVTEELGQISKSDALPLLIWHGLGDAFDSDGIKSVADLYQELFPNSMVYRVAAAETGSADRQASWFGSVNDQINNTCNDLRNHTVLSNAPGVNALGFSQGGQFLRGLVERCNVPPVKNLITFGSQHNGISKFQKCATTDLLCRSWAGLLQSNAWSHFAQTRLVPAQYFRDPEDLGSYLNYSSFLADINNERKNKTKLYKRNLASMDKFVMYMFDDDEVVHPKESSWFAEVNTTTGKVTPLEERQLFKEDWLGLQALSKKGGLRFETAAGKHMQLDHRLLKSTFEQYFNSSLGEDSTEVQMEDIDYPADHPARPAAAKQQILSPK